MRRSTVVFAAAVLLAGCVDVQPGPIEPAPSGSLRPTSTTAASSEPGGSTEHRSAQPAIVPAPATLARRLGCDGEPQPVGVDAAGGVVLDNVEKLTLEQAFAHFLDVEGQIAYLPLEGWTVAEHGSGWAAFEHVVGTDTKAIVSLSTEPEPSGGMRWTWSVAACDPAEFDAAVAVTNSPVIWTNAGGRRAPFSRVGERSVCLGARPTFLLVDGLAFASAGSPYLAERALATYTADVPVPANARDSGYRHAGQRIWIAGDARSAYVGRRDHAQRLPRIRNDDISITDCN